MYRFLAFLLLAIEHVISRVGQNKQPGSLQPTWQVNLTLPDAEKETKMDMFKNNCVAVQTIPIHPACSVRPPTTDDRSRPNPGVFMLRCPHENRQSLRNTMPWLVPELVYWSGATTSAQMHNMKQSGNTTVRSGETEYCWGVFFLGGGFVWSITYIQQQPEAYKSPGKSRQKASWI